MLAKTSTATGDAAPGNLYDCDGENMRGHDHKTVELDARKAGHRRGTRTQNEPQAAHGHQRMRDVESQAAESTQVAIAMIFPFTTIVAKLLAAHGIVLSVGGLPALRWRLNPTVRVPAAAGALRHCDGR
jgi:hypothetical protein